MTKYYTMKECFDACGDDDIPYLKETGEHEGFNGAGLSKKELLRISDDLSPDLLIALSDKWQIKRAAPVVLSAEAWIKKHNLDSTVYPLWEAFQSGDQNGQLREWLRPEQVELRRVAKEAMVFLKSFRQMATTQRLSNMLRGALDNLKPPRGV